MESSLKNWLYTELDNKSKRKQVGVERQRGFDLPFSNSRHLISQQGDENKGEPSSKRPIVLHN